MALHLLGDVTALCAQRPTGVGTYVSHLFHALAHHPDVELAGVWNLSRLRARQFGHLPAWLRTRSRPRIPFLTGRLWQRGEVFHGPDFRIPATIPMARVVTVHDLVCFHEGHTHPRFAELARARIRETLALRPEAIVVPSHAVAEEFIERYPEWNGRIHAIHHGCDHVPTTSRVSLARPLPAPYLLCVGNVERRKNLEAAAAAFDALAQRNPDLHLIVAGKEGFAGAEVLAAVRSVRASNRIIHKSWVSDEELLALYEHAEALLFLSHYEGFGFPVLEAMRRGCPVIVADHGAAAEIAGDAALRVRKENPDELVERVWELLGSASRRNELRARGLAHAERFTWSACAEGHLRAYAAARKAHGSPSGKGRLQGS